LAVFLNFEKSLAQSIVQCHNNARQAVMQEIVAKKRALCCADIGDPFAKFFVRLA
jgi:hypothetical protein